MKGHKKNSPAREPSGASERIERALDAGLSPLDVFAEQAAFGNSYLAEQLGEGEGGHASEDPEQPRRCLQRPSVLCRCPAEERARKEAGDPMDCSRINGWSNF